MQLSAVCAAAVSARQTEEGCSLRLTLLTRLWASTPPQTRRKQASNTQLCSLCSSGVMLARVGEKCRTYHISICSHFKTAYSFYFRNINRLSLCVTYSVFFPHKKHTIQMIRKQKIVFVCIKTYLVISSFNDLL